MALHKIKKESEERVKKAQMSMSYSLATVILTSKHQSPNKGRSKMRTPATAL